VLWGTVERWLDKGDEMSTNFPNGLESYGMPLLGGGGTLPKMGGSGTVFFVDPANGNDENSGKRPDDALDTVGQAYSMCTDKQGDVIYYLNDGNTSGSSREATIPITWSKDNTHLVGLCSPTMVSQRCRITPVVGGALTANPVISLTGHGCVIANVAIQHWGSTDSIASRGLDVTGNRNVIYNCHIAGICHAHAGDEAAEDLRVNGSENLFERCTVGLDTIARGANNASANVRFGDGSSNYMATRNVFKDCIFPMYADDTEPVFIKYTGAFDVQRWNLFQGCTFVNTGTSTAAAAVSWPGLVAGILLLKDCAFYGMTDVTAADNSNVLLQGSVGSAGSAVDMGHFVAVDIA
jgi:hypothetical protein